MEAGSSTSSRSTRMPARSAPAFGSRMVATTSKPRRASSVATARPMPRLAPVTSATPSGRTGLLEVALEPVERALEGVLGRGRDVLRPLVAVEAVAGVGIADDVVVDLRVRVERRPQLLDVVDRDRLVEVAEQAQPRGLEPARVAHQGGELGEPGGDEAAAVEADGGAEGAPEGDEERDAAAEAEADDAGARRF